MHVPPPKRSEHVSRHFLVGGGPLGGWPTGVWVAHWGGELRNPQYLRFLNSWFTTWGTDAGFPQAGLVRICLKTAAFFDWFWEQQRNAAASGASCLSGAELKDLQTMFLHPMEFWLHFKPDDLPTAEDIEKTTPAHLLSPKLERLMNDVGQSQKMQKALKLLFDVRCHVYDSDFSYLVNHTDVPFAQFLDKNADYELDGLRNAYQEVLEESLSGPQNPQQGLQEIEEVPGDEESERRAEVQREVLRIRKERVKFHSLGNYMDSTGIFQKGGKATQIYGESRSAGFKGDPGKSNALIMISADLLPSKRIFGSADSYKESHALESDIFEKALKWMPTVKGPSTVLVAFDGRSRKHRRKIEDWMEATMGDVQREAIGTLLYDPARKGDIRWPGAEFGCQGSLFKKPRRF